MEIRWQTGPAQCRETHGEDLKIDQSKGGPKVLIYHTHSQEAFADSTEGDTSTTIMGMGTYLSDLLNNTYGIETLHHEGVYDLVDGKLDRSMAYQLAEPQIQNILAENPSIESRSLTFTGTAWQKGLIW